MKPKIRLRSGEPYPWVVIDARGWEHKFNKWSTAIWWAKRHYGWLSR